jgi:hypothetical protein
MSDKVESLLDANMTSPIDREKATMPEKQEVYAVVRIDQRDSIEDAIAVTAILPTMEEAVSEVERLNGLNKGKGAHYFWRATRYFPKGKGIPPEAPE